jgi:hypothetical protein
MSQYFFLYLIHLLIIIAYVNSVIKYSININNETYTLDHEKMNNSSESERNYDELANQNFYLCEDKKDCISCSFLMYQYASCYWDCDHNQCKTEYYSTPFTQTNDLSKVYKLCSSCDSSTNEKMKKNCNETLLIEEKMDDEEKGTKAGNNENNTEIKIHNFNYSQIDFKGLLCKYYIINKNTKVDSLFHLNITKYYRYINMFVELDYGLYMRHINLKNLKNYDIDTVGVNSIAIYVYTPEDYDLKPFSIIYSFKVLKKSAILQVVIFMTAAIVVIFSVLLILIFIELKKGNMVKYGKKEYNLNINTLIFNKIKYNQNSFEKLNKKCFFCSHDFISGNFITILKCKKHIYHYACLLKWVRENRFDKTNFFCPICQNEEFQEFSRSIISKEDNDRLLSSNKTNMLNKGILKHKSDLKEINQANAIIDNNNNNDKINNQDYNNDEDKKEDKNNKNIKSNDNIIKNKNEVINEDKNNIRNDKNEEEDKKEEKK